MTIEDPTRPEEGLEFAGHELSRASLDACVKCTICERSARSQR